MNSYHLVFHIALDYLRVRFLSTYDANRKNVQILQGVKTQPLSLDIESNGSKGWRYVRLRKN